MAGHSSGWMKSAKGGSAKGKRFISKAMIERYVSGGISSVVVMPEDIAKTRRMLKEAPALVDYFADSIAPLVDGGRPLTGTAKKKLPTPAPMGEPSYSGGALLKADYEESGAGPYWDDSEDDYEGPGPGGDEELGATFTPVPDKPKVKRSPAGVSKKIPQRPQFARDELDDRLIREARRSEEWRTESEKLPASDAVVRKTAISTLKRVIANTHVSMRIPSAVLSKILDGGFKNQHQTGTSRGTLNPEYRARAEANMFGIVPGSKPEDYPIYGYLSPKEGDDDSATTYGDAQIIFKDSIRKRTTVSAGDSLGDGAADRLMPSPLGKPTIAAMDGNLDVLVKRKDAPVATLAQRVGYFEVQIHGKTSRKDIAEVRFASEPSAEIAARLNALGIPWTSGKIRAY